MRKIRVFQEDAYLSLDYQNQSGEIYRRVDGRITRDKVQIEREEPLKRQLMSFIECASTGRPPRVSGFQATAALELAVEITKRISRGPKRLRAPAFCGTRRPLIRFGVAERRGYKIDAHRTIILSPAVSGDNHGAALMQSSAQLNVGSWNSSGGVPQMKTIAGERFKTWIENAAVLGLWEVVKNYGYFRQQFHETLAKLMSRNPTPSCLIDYPGFNLRLARAARNVDQRKIIYYISPQVWAWNRGRIKEMAQYLDLMLCIFPFEAGLYNKSGLRTKFVGHPMIDRLRVRKIDIERDPNLIGLFPEVAAAKSTRFFRSYSRPPANFAK